MKQENLTKGLWVEITSCYIGILLAVYYLYISEAAMVLGDAGEHKKNSYLECINCRPDIYGSPDGWY